jgi:hypothetical protein
MAHPALALGGQRRNSQRLPRRMRIALHQNPLGVPGPRSWLLPRRQALPAQPPQCVVERQAIADKALVGSRQHCSRQSGFGGGVSARSPPGRRPARCPRISTPAGRRASARLRRAPGTACSAAAPARPPAAEYGSFQRMMSQAIRGPFCSSKTTPKSDQLRQARSTERTGMGSQKLLLPGRARWMAINSSLRYTDLVRLASGESLFPKWF